MATRFVKGSYQEIIDLHTESDHVTALGIHTPTGTTPRQMFKGFFDQYKKYKYLGCSIKLVPAARLPADPLAVSYDAGEPTIDPRDMLNPLMFHGCHGNDLGTILNRLYGDNNEISDSVDGLDTFGLAGGNWIQNPNALMFNEVMERLYYKALTDNTWKKAHPQRGFMKKGLHPLVYSMATNRQLMPGSLIDVSDVDDYGDLSITGADPTTEFSESGDNVRSLVSRNGVQFFTPRLTSLGWMDTRNELTTAQDFVPVGSDLDDIAPSINNLAVSQINFAELPKIYMGVILLPPAYKTEQYYRMVVNHRFAFKGFRGISFMPEVGNVPSYYNANSDLFSPDQYGGTTTSGGGSTGGDVGGGDEPGGDEPGSGGDVGGATVGVLSVAGNATPVYCQLSSSPLLRVNPDAYRSVNVSEGDASNPTVVSLEGYTSSTSVDGSTARSYAIVESFGSSTSLTNGPYLICRCTNTSTYAVTYIYDKTDQKWKFPTSGTEVGDYNSLAGGDSNLASVIPASYWDDFLATIDFS